MRKTTATVALAISATLVFSACGSADEPEVLSSEPSLSEQAAPETEEPEAASETTIEVEEPVSTPTPVDEEPAEAPIPVENIPSEKTWGWTFRYYGGETDPVTDSDREKFEIVTVKPGDTLEVFFEPWLFGPGKGCFDDDDPYSEWVLNEETGEYEQIFSYRPEESLTMELDSRVLVRPGVPPAGSPDPGDPGNEWVKNPVLNDLPEGTNHVLHEVDDPAQFFGFTFAAAAPGSSLLRVSYSCEPTGEAFDTTWIIDVE